VKPILFRVFDYGVPSYAVLMALGYVIALAVLWKVTPKQKDGEEKPHLNRPQVWDLFIVMVVSSVVGSKFGHVLFEAPGHVGEKGQPINSLWELLVEDPLHWARLGEPGYVWYGGMVGALAVAAFYFYRRPHLNAWHYSDAFAPAIMAGAAVGRLGCFMAGCCYGVESDAPWAVAFPGVAGGPRHPTQLYDAFIAASLGALLLWRFGRRRFHGENIALLLISYPILRGITEIFRGDPERGYFGPLSTSQLISILVGLAGVALYVKLAKNKARGEQSLVASEA
jgi:phosphatidylglycerol---prolipoprotein diacylglyceryl transferase